MSSLRITGTLAKNARRSVEAGGAAAWLTLVLSVDGQREDIVAEWRYGAGDFAVNEGSVRAARRLTKGTPVVVTARDYRIDPKARRLQLLNVTDVAQLNIPAPVCEPNERD